MNNYLIGAVVLAIGLVMIGSPGFSTMEQQESTPMMILSDWGWVFSALGLALMYLKIPRKYGELWAMGILSLVIYIVLEVLA